MSPLARAAFDAASNISAAWLYSLIDSLLLTFALIFYAVVMYFVLIRAAQEESGAVGVLINLFFIAFGLFLVAYLTER